MPSQETFIKQQLIGPYAIGEIPSPLQITITDYDGAVIDLTDFTAKFKIVRLDDDTPSGLATGSSTIFDASNGVTQYSFVAADFTTSGHYRGVMWVGDGSVRYSSDMFEWFIRDNGTTAPSI